MLLLFALNILSAATLGVGTAYLFWAHGQRNRGAVTWIVWFASIATLVGWVWGTGYASQQPSASNTIEAIALVLQLLAFSSSHIAMRMRLRRVHTRESRG